jgi:hypothetical protein
MVVEMRECRICPCTDFGSAPACTIQVAQDVRRHLQSVGKPSANHKKGCCCTKFVQLTSSAIQHIIAPVPSTALRPCFSLPAMGAGRSGFHAYTGC